MILGGDVSKVRVGHRNTMSKSKATLKNIDNRPFVFSEKVGIKSHNYKNVSYWVNTKCCETSKKYKRLTEILSDADFLKAMYDKLRSDIKDIAFNEDRESIITHITNVGWFQKTSILLMEGVYIFKPARCVAKKKLGRVGKKRSLVVTNLRDKMIQEGMKTILSCIYESGFSNLSYSHRPKTNAHKALEQVSRWNDIEWFVRLDIEKSFNTINEKYLISLMKEKIEDYLFFDILKNMFQAKIFYIQLDTSNEVLQDSSLSCLIYNIYLSELDHFSEKEMKKVKLDLKKSYYTAQVENSEIAWRHVN